jgi:uncharacterized glyoxalase superfamily protein PhnB
MEDTMFRKLTPNLVVSDISKSLDFYTRVLGFTLGMHVPDNPPYVFAAVTAGPVEIFLNDRAEVAKDMPDLAKREPNLCLYIEVDDVDGLHAKLMGAEAASVLKPPHTQFYGMREFVVRDPDGHLLMFAQRVQG